MENPHRRRALFSIGAVIAVLAVSAAGAVYIYWVEFVPVASLAINYFRSLNAPPGVLTIEVAASEHGPASDTSLTPNPHETELGAANDDWPSYNKTLTSERFSQLSEINSNNVNRLKVLCAYDTRQYTGFETGLIMVNGSLIGTTEHDIFSLDPYDCHEKWRTSEDYRPATPQAVNRGAAYSDGRLFRGTEDGRVLAYDFATGKRIWEAEVADPKIGETTPAAPIVWNGLVFIGNAGGDIKGVKGRMYALNAQTGKIVWEFYLAPKTEGDRTRGPQASSPLDASSWINDPGFPITGGATWTSYTLDPSKGLLYVPGGNAAPDFAADVRGGENLYTHSIVILDAKTGAYQKHFKLMAKDWHDWDASTAPALVRTRGGINLLSVAPKDGHLYGFDLDTNLMLYKTPATRMLNGDATFSSGKSVHFCPGSTGGAEWNGPAYDPRTNLILIGEVDWCTTVTLQGQEKLKATKFGEPWSGEDTINPYHTWGTPDPVGQWGGWLYAIDADSGEWKWRARSNYPIMSGVTPTAGGLVFFGDMGGNFYALAATDGRKLWGEKIGGGIGGGVITYSIAGNQRVAVAVGFTSILWPTEVTTGKVVILGLEQSRNAR